MSDLDGAKSKRPAPTEMVCTSRGQYVDTIARTLYLLLSLRDFPCQDVERRSKPEIEFGLCTELLLAPKIIGMKDMQEICLVEPSINSTRISFQFRRGDDLEYSLANTFHRFLGMKADHLHLLRRTPVASYDVSFLVTSELLHQHGPMSIILSLVKFAEDVPYFLRCLKEDVLIRQRQNFETYFSSQ